MPAAAAEENETEEVGLRDFLRTSTPPKPKSPSYGGLSSAEVDRIAALEARVQTLEQERNHLEETLAALAKETVDNVSKRMIRGFDDIELMREETKELSVELSNRLAEWSRERTALSDFLASTPDAIVFPSGRVKLRVGEHVYHTSTATLAKDPGSMLAAMFSGKFALTKDEEGCYFIDRDGELFSHILEYLRSSAVPADLSVDLSTRLLREAEFYGIQALSQVLRERMTSTKEDDSGGRSTMVAIQAMATTNFVQSVIASLAEVTHLAFRQMAADAERGLQDTTLTFLPGQNYHEFFVNADGTVKNTLSIFLELLRQEGAPCVLLSPSSSSQAVIIRCSLLHPERVICQEVLRNFKKVCGLFLLLPKIHQYSHSSLSCPRCGDSRKISKFEAVKDHLRSHVLHHLAFVEVQMP